MWCSGGFPSCTVIQPCKAREKSTSRVHNALEVEEIQKDREHHYSRIKITSVQVYSVHGSCRRKTPFKSSERIPKSLDYDSRLIKTASNKYYLCIPRAICTSPETKRRGCQKPNNIACIDPGVRTFGTVYAPLEQKAYKWGHGDFGRIQRLCEHASNLQSAIDRKADGKNRNRMRVAFRRMHERIKNLIRDFHHCFSKWLCEHYQVIVLPRFESQKMSRRSTRKIGKKTVRAMLTWSHFSFRQRLIAKAALYQNCHVMITTEEYTTKTCTRCGVLHQKIGGKKQFKCPSCQFEIDRDVNGSKGICLLTLSQCAGSRQ